MKNKFTFNDKVIDITTELCGKVIDVLDGDSEDVIDSSPAYYVDFLGFQSWISERDLVLDSKD
jgi:hypothetical protein